MQSVRGHDSFSTLPFYFSARVCGAVICVRGGYRIYERGGGTINYKVIKNIKNVAGCRDTRTAKSKETRGMIEHNSEVYNHPYRDLLPYIHVQ